MPATDYPELQGMPSGCMQTLPWGFDPIEVSAPYQGVDEAVVMQEPIISVDMPADQFEIFNGEDAILNLDSPGVSIGYKTPGEMTVLLNRLSPLASALKNNTALYHPDAKAAIIALASEAYELLVDNRTIYADFDIEGKNQYESNQGGYTWFPLSIPDDDVFVQVKQSPGYGSSMQQRADARDQIRENYLKALYLLWCALYGKNQSLAWRENRIIYTQAHQPVPGGGFQTGTNTPPPPSGKPGRVSQQQGQQPPPGDTGPFPGGQPPPGDTGPFPGGDPGSGPGSDPGDGYEPPGNTGPFPDGFPPEQPSAPSKKKSGGGAGAALVIGVVAVALLASKK